MRIARRGASSERGESRAGRSADLTAPAKGRRVGQSDTTGSDTGWPGKTTLGRRIVGHSIVARVANYAPS